MINIRSPDLRDAAALAALGRRTFVDTFGELYAPSDLQSFLAQTYGEEAIAAELNNADLLWQVAEVDGRLVGWSAFVNCSKAWSLTTRMQMQARIS